MTTPHPDPQQTAVHPTPTWVFQSLPRILAFGFGSGLLRPAPGTWGTLLAWPLWVWGVSSLPDGYVAAFLLLGFALGCWVCDRTGKEMGMPDHGGMVWDEMIAFWLVLWLVPATWEAQTSAFVLFRLFDIVKPPPIRYFDKRLKNGFGVMWDDILAAGFSLLVMAILVRLQVFT